MSAVEPRERGFALETRFGVTVGGSNMLSLVAGITDSNLGGSVFAGYKLGRVELGLGISPGGAAGIFSGRTATAFSVAVSPGVRITLIRSSDRKLELAGELDLGIGRTFATLGEGWDTVLGLPPGTTSIPYNLQVSGSVGPLVRYWFHPRLALLSSVLLGVSYSHIASSGPADLDSNRVQLRITVGAGLLVVL